MRSRRPERLSRADGAFALSAARRHVDLLRVSSALCPGGRCPAALSDAHGAQVPATR